MHHCVPTGVTTMVGTKGHGSRQEATANYMLGVPREGFTGEGSLKLDLEG